MRFDALDWMEKKGKITERLRLRLVRLEWNGMEWIRL
jgi:hypothetical protein